MCGTINFCKISGNSRQESGGEQFPEIPEQEFRVALVQVYVLDISWWHSYDSVIVIMNV